MRILVLTPWAPYPLTGACQQDRFSGLKQMRSMGYDIHVLARTLPFQSKEQIERIFATEGIPITLIPHTASPWKLIAGNIPAILRHPALLDGAALEYLDAQYLSALRFLILSQRPDLIWMEYCTHWPLLRILKSEGIPIIVKSSLNEPQHCIDEHGGSLMARLKALPKKTGERIVARNADLVLAITPDEERWYRSLGATHTGVLPLRGLSQCFERRSHSAKDRLDVVFLSASYNVGHNRDALLFLLKEILPEVRRRLPGHIRFHLTGGKFREEWKRYLSDDLRLVGYVPDLSGFLRTMDAAVCPWISGQGMQQKVFEPLCRSLPLLTTKTAGYPFVDGKEVLLCATPQQYADGLEKLLDPALRNAVAAAAYEKAWSLFNEEIMKRTVKEAIESVINT
ncbi:MAG: glycosyltransferase [Candidatus Peribacteraceae bacterium]|nr:glycosyltransferase [Candidatus Peribacteraceae bacterium]